MGLPRQLRPLRMPSSRVCFGTDVGWDSPTGWLGYRRVRGGCSLRHGTGLSSYDCLIRGITGVKVLQSVRGTAEDGDLELLRLRQALSKSTSSMQIRL